MLQTVFTFLFTNSITPFMVLVVAASLGWLEERSYWIAAAIYLLGVVLNAVVRVEFGF